MRTAQMARDTNETRIRLTLELDGTGASRIDSGCGFLNHMLTLLAAHGRFDLEVSCKGDTDVDDHHTVEDIGIALGQAFTKALGDRRGVLQEKTSVLDTMPDDAVAFCNGDDDLLCAMTCRQRKVTFGLSAGCDVRAVDVRDLGDEGSTCTIIAGTRRIPVRISAYGQHMVYAALEGAAVGIEYGLTDDEIIRGIAAYQPVGSRARVVRTARYTVIDDCYNANPDSTAAALRSMATLPAGRRVAVLGNMGELGAPAAALHRETGVCAAKAGVSLVITCGELARQIAAGAAAEDPAVATASFDTLDALLPALPGLLQPGDCVLVKASHSMQFERIVQALTQA